MKYYLIAGERSGDLHASNLMKEILILDSNADFRFFGGDMMQAVGGKLTTHYREMAFMGFLEVFLNLDKVWANIKKCKSDIAEYQPDMLILVDYSGFNLKIAKHTKKKFPHIKTHYFILPKIWAWYQSRAKNIHTFIDKMYAILPFEKPFFEKYNCNVEYVGNPCVDTIAQHSKNVSFLKDNNLQDKPIIAILPGSRKNEVEYMLHFMVSILPGFKDYQFVIAAIDSLDIKYYEAFRREGIVSVVYEQTYDLLLHSKVAIVTSGTATLETALLKVPQVVCYATSGITYMIIRALIKVKYISLVNLIAEKEVVKELIQDNFTPTNVMNEIRKILENKEYRNQILNDYESIISTLGEVPASKNAALSIVNSFQK